MLFAAWNRCGFTATSIIRLSMQGFKFRVKNEDEEQESLRRSSEQLEKAREELSKRLMREELEFALRLEAVDRLMTDLKVDPEDFRRLWIQPLLTAGATWSVALACIAKSHFQPN